MKKNMMNNSSSDANNVEVPKTKERHIVSWSQEEDDILREQIRLHGTENWTIIASKFTDKTTRQCRRRWFTYLNSDFKKGGWTPEEDMLLCEAQKIFGNRWTEIAKVVSGRTDNAVKNRFTTLCKKRAKQEAFAKENCSTTSFINLNNKRVIFPDGLIADGGSESSAPYKKLRTYIKQNCNQDASEGVVADHLLRPPFAVLPQDAQSSEVNFTNQLHVGGTKEAPFDGSANDKPQGTFLKKDNPKVLALMQQAELLSSLATKINSEKMDQSLESAWMVLQDFLKQNKESDLLTSGNLDTDFQLEKFEKLMEDLRSSTESSRSSSRELSPASSEYSTGSTVMTNAPGDEPEVFEEEMCKLHQEDIHQLQSDQLKDQHCPIEERAMCNTASANEGKDMLTCNDTDADGGALCKYPNADFNSPLHVTPLFSSLAAAIPSPIFSESEKHFLMKTLGMESSQSTIPNPSQPPQCKRSLLHCL